MIRTGRMLRVRCKVCGKELSNENGKSQCCGCSNITSIINDRITAKDLSKVVILSNTNNKKTNKSVLSDSDIAWHESRRHRKIRKLDFEVR